MSMKTLLGIVVGMLLLASSVNAQIFGSVGIGGCRGGIFIGVSAPIICPIYTYPVVVSPVVYPAWSPVVVYSQPVIYRYPAPYCYGRGPVFYGGCGYRGHWNNNYRGHQFRGGRR